MQDVFSKRSRAVGFSTRIHKLFISAQFSSHCHAGSCPGLLWISVLSLIHSQAPTSPVSGLLSFPANRGRAVLAHPPCPALSVECCQELCFRGQPCSHGLQQALALHCSRAGAGAHSHQSWFPRGPAPLALEIPVNRARGSHIHPTARG